MLILFLADYASSSTSTSMSISVASIHDADDFTLGSSIQSSAIPISMQEVQLFIPIFRVDVIHSTHPHTTEHTRLVLEWLSILYSQRSRSITYG